MVEIASVEKRFSRCNPISRSEWSKSVAGNDLIR